MGRSGQKGNAGVGSSVVAAGDGDSTCSQVLKSSPSQHRTNIQNVATPSRGGRGGGDRRGGGEGNGGRSSTHSGQLEDIMRRKGIDEAWSALEDMQRQNIVTDKYTVSRMLMKTVGDGRVRVNTTRVYRCIGIVEKFIDTQPKDVDEVLFNALLDTCCRLKDLPRLEAIASRMRDLKVTPSPVTLGILVKTYGQAGDLTKVLQVWEEMEEQRGQANAVTYGCMIDACVKNGNLAKAVEIFQGMRVDGKHKNTILYTTLIKGHGIEKDLKRALELFREMAVEGVPYNTITFNSMIDACIKCQDLKMAESLMCEMTDPASVFEPDLITFSTLLKGYCNVGDLDKALQVAQAIKDRGLRTDELVYNTLMDGCVKANDIPAGIGLFEELVNSGMRPSAITHGILLRLYQRAGSEENAADAVAQLYQQHGIERPNGERLRGGGGGGRNKTGHLSGQQRTSGGYRGEHAGQQSPAGSHFSGASTPYGGSGASTPYGGNRDDGCWWGDMPGMHGYNMRGPSEPSTPGSACMRSAMPTGSPFLHVDAMQNAMPPFPFSRDGTPYGGVRPPTGFGFTADQPPAMPVGMPPMPMMQDQQQQHHQQQAHMQQIQQLLHQQQQEQHQLQHQQQQQLQHQQRQQPPQQLQQQQQQQPQQTMPMVPFPANATTPANGMGPTSGVNTYPEAYFESWNAGMTAANACQPPSTLPSGR